ncbi:hypothetical protein L3Q82_005935 [Scortum barcoo]|uniref:Uncharacterized protein n=1 Tax=Scortum barcoo TaxID=214431 RepID=A0ACB8X2B7_9TELE|nr:hypothetical protein L3Q82_005935 [Scortum barcoo]
MKCFERLVLAHLKTCLPPTLDPHQFAYRSNRSAEDAVSTVLHCVLSHLENKNTYARMLFVDFSSAFNTVIPSKLITKLGDLGISTPLRYWIMTFLTNRPQHVRSGSSTITLNTGAPQGCVLSPFLYSLFTHDCRPMYGSNSITKFADDIMVIGLISDNDDKTKELIVDFRKVKRETHDPIHINGMAVEHVSSFKFLGTHISENLSWTANTSSLIKKAHQRLFFLEDTEEEPSVHCHPRQLLPRMRRLSLVIHSARLASPAHLCPINPIKPFTLLQDKDRLIHPLPARPSVNRHLMLSVNFSLFVTLFLLTIRGLISGDKISPVGGEVSKREGQSVTLTCNYETSYSSIAYFTDNNEGSRVPDLLDNSVLLNVTEGKEDTLATPPGDVADHEVPPATLPRFEPFSPESRGSSVDVKLKIRLARLQLEAQEKERKADHELKLQRKQSSSSLPHQKGMGLIKKVSPLDTEMTQSEGDEPDPCFKPFISVFLTGDAKDQLPVKILRDTGALSPLFERVYYLYQSPLASGFFTVAVLPALPIKEHALDADMARSKGQPEIHPADALPLFSNQEDAKLPATREAFITAQQGPYVVEKKLSENNYIVKTPDRRRQTRVCHVNMMKMYRSREDQNSSSSDHVKTAVSPMASVSKVLPSPPVQPVD